MPAGAYGNDSGLMGSTTAAPITNGTQMVNNFLAGKYFPTQDNHLYQTPMNYKDWYADTTRTSVMIANATNDSKAKGIAAQIAAGVLYVDSNGG